MLHTRFAPIFALLCLVCLAPASPAALKPFMLEVGESGKLPDIGGTGCVCKVARIEGPEEAVIVYIERANTVYLLLRGLPTKNWADGKRLENLDEFVWTVTETKKVSTYGTIYALDKKK